MGLFSGLFDSNDKQIKNIQPIIDQINDLEPEMQKLTDEQMRAKTDEFRKRLNVEMETARDNDIDKAAQKEALMEILPEAFALVREAAHRVAQHRHFEVQLIAGYFLADNKISELFTGEGKTNAATLAMYLYALTGRGAHLITVNDYLARRDGEWNGHVLNLLGMSVGVINSGQQYKYVSDEEAIALKGDDAKEEIEARKIQQKQVGRLKLDMMEGTNLVECSKQDTYNCDLVYGTNNEFGFDYLRDNMAQRLQDRVQTTLHYTIIDEADSILIDEARTPLIISQSAQASNDLYVQFAQISNQLEDENHYVVDEKASSVAITDEGIDKVESILNVDNVYEDPKFAYHLENSLKAKELYTKDDEYIIRDGEIVIVDEFTGRALPGRRYSEGLHQAIEAKEGVEVKRESKTLATITLQNYFRLYDYMAGMTATALTEAEEFAKVYNLDVVVVPTNKPVVRQDDNDVVYRTVQGKFRAIAEDIKDAHNAGQPVLVGTTSVEKSEYLSDMLSKDGIPHEVLNAKHHEKEARIVQKAGQSGQVTIATNMAGRGTDIALGPDVIEAGGLYVIGSERHESRRIDNQLRGRSGRQGDPGRSRFYVSFEDDLMRLFGGDRMQGVMERVGMEDDLPISLGMMGKSIENAQKKVESHNFDIRKRLVEYDDVMNQQREIIYSLRKQILKLLDDDDLKEESEDFDLKSIKDVDLNDLLEDIEGFTFTNRSTWDVSELEKYPAVDRPIHYWLLKRYFDKIRFIISAQLSDDMKIDDVEERKTIIEVKALLTDELEEKAAKAFGYGSVIDFYKDLDGDKKSVVVEEMLLRYVLAGYLAHVYTIGPKLAYETARVLVLQTIDHYWMEHLDSMADLREGVGMQSMAQRDPLVAYKNEGFQLFDKMLQDIDDAVTTRFLKVRIVQQTATPVEQGEAMHEGSDAIQEVKAKRVGSDRPIPRRSSNAPQPPQTSSTDERPGDMSSQQTITNDREKIGRNDPCPCGSGKKYKKCHLDKDPQTSDEKAAFNLYFTDNDSWKKKYL